MATVGQLTFAVGTATLQDGTTGLNVVAFFRQANGNSATLLNEPSITGPAGFTLPAGSPETKGATIGNGAGTTFGASGGLFGGGFAGFDTTSTVNADYPGGQGTVYTEPFSWTGAGSPVELLVGPPVTGLFTDATYPTGFAGYLPGFQAFEVAPVAGSYALGVTVPTSTTSYPFSATATLASAVAALAVTAAPTFVEDGAGGGTVHFVAPAGTVESVAFIHDTKNGAFYSIETKGAGAQAAALTGSNDTDGPCAPLGPGCGAKSLATGDTYTITVASFDYNDVESTPPQSSAQQPALGLPASGQADVSISPALAGTY